MSDEFDEADARVPWHLSSSGDAPANARTRVSAARLVCRLYRSADQSLRAKLLACLVRPLSPLGLVVVAAGAFAGFLRRGSVENLTGAIVDVAQYSSQQIFELASFVEPYFPRVAERICA